MAELILQEVNREPPPGRRILSAAHRTSRFVLTFFGEGDPRPPVMVVSHERSGTHLLMNSLGQSYGYDSHYYCNFDHRPLGINFFRSGAILDTLQQLADQRLASVVKSHHEAAFLAKAIDRILERWIVFYVHRDPVDVMLSYWRFMHGWTWDEGPRTADPLAFARAAPAGQMMRYQVRQHPTILSRWASHVDGWLNLAANRPRIVVTRYADLVTDYANTLRGFAPLLGCQPENLVLPSRGENYVPGKLLPPNLESRAKTAPPALRALCRELVGPTMLRAGYDAGGAPAAANRGKARPAR